MPVTAEIGVESVMPSPVPTGGGLGGGRGAGERGEPVPCSLGSAAPGPRHAVAAGDAAGAACDLRVLREATELLLWGARRPPLPAGALGHAGPL